MSARIHVYRWQLCAGPEGGCTQAAENRYGTQPLDDAPSPKTAALKKAPSEGWKLSDFNCDVTHHDEWRALAWAKRPKTSRVFEENSCLLFGATRERQTFPSEE